MFDQKKLYCGSKLKVKNNCIYIAEAYNHRLYNAKICVYVKRQDNEIVVFIYGKPKTRVAANWFIEFNNRLVETFKKYGLHNISDKEVFIVNRKYGLKEFLKKYY